VFYTFILQSKQVSKSRLHITDRELEILKLVAYEYSNQEIAAHLDIAVGTVETHRRSLFHKLGAKNMAGMIKRAFDKGLLIPSYILLSLGAHF